jgi:hypothetical protein
VFSCCFTVLIPLLVRNQIGDFHSMQEAVEMSTDLLRVRKARRKRGSSDKESSLIDNTVLCIHALLYKNGNLLCSSFPC